MADPLAKRGEGGQFQPRSEQTADPVTVRLHEDRQDQLEALAKIVGQRYLSTLARKIIEQFFEGEGWPLEARDAKKHPYKKLYVRVSDRFQPAIDTFMDERRYDFAAPLFRQIIEGYLALKENV